AADSCHQQRKQGRHLYRECSRPGAYCRAVLAAVGAIKHVTFMPNLIDLMAGLEQQTLNIPAGAPGAAQTTIAVTGWAWWQLAVARFTINNSAGAAVAWPFVSMLSGAIVVFTAGTSISVAVGSFGVPSFGMFAGNTTGASLVLMSG